MSAFSVVVDVDNQAAPKGLPQDKRFQAEARRGATYFLMTTLPGGDQNVSISIVGEIPPVVAQKVTLSMR